MVISWYGEGCFRIQNGEAVLLSDVPTKASGVAAPRVTPTVYVKTITAWPPTGKPVEERAQFTIEGPGEYDMGGIRIKGIQLMREASEKFFKTVYRVVWDDVSIGLLGHLSEELEPQTLEAFEEVDVLIAPGGGDPFLAQEKVAKMVKQLNPKIFIPSFFSFKGLARKAAPVKTIAEMFNGDVRGGENKFVFKKKDLADIKKTKVVWLSV